MRLKLLMATIVVALTGLVGPAGVAQAAATPAAAAAGVDAASTLHARPCTRTSSGKCIRGGQFCPRSKYGKSGWDARGRRYVCKGDRSHPHWMRP
jgi:hypothetical protein